MLPTLLLALAMAAPAETGETGDTGDARCDLDGDGHASLYCGGDDCNDGDAAVNPDISETIDDGIDQDCDGLDRIGDEGATPLYLAGGSGTCSSSPGAARWMGAALALSILRRRRTPCAR